MHIWAEFVSRTITYVLRCRGLLVSKMYKTATAIVTNLISLIEEYGFVLNGARAYYTNRRYRYPILSSGFSVV